MLLYCPKCNTGYDIEPGLIPEKGKKMRCAKCGEIWYCTPKDLIEPPLNEAPSSSEKDLLDQVLTEVSTHPDNTETSETKLLPEENDVEVSQSVEPGEAVITDIFARLSTQTEELFKQEQTQAKPKRLWMKIKHLLGLDHPGTLKYYLLGLVLLVALLLFGVRFDLVRRFPAAEKIYNAVGIEARIVGEGLEYQNVVRNEYEEDYIRKLEIKGFIVNTNPFKVDMPLIHVEVMDKDTNILQSINDKAPIATLEPDGRMAFRIVINQPSPLTKFILLTFAKSNTQN